MNVEEIQAICKAIPSVTEAIKWGHDLVFSIGGKMFCVVGLNDFPATASFKVKKEEFEELCNRDGFKPAPYAAKYNWVLIDDLEKMTKKEWHKYIEQAYELVKDKLPAKIKKQLGDI